MSEAASPFSPRAVLALVLFGSAVFVALLYTIGAGMMTGSTKDGGAHGGGTGLNGYAALAGYLEKRGYTVRRSMSEAALDDAGLLVLTPPHQAKGDELEKIVSARRHRGPTLIVTPKWLAAAAQEGTPGIRQGWVVFGGAQPPNWPGFLDDVTVEVTPMRTSGQTAAWSGAGLAGELPNAEFVLSGKGARLVPLVTGRQDGRVLAAYYADDGSYPALEEMAGVESRGEEEDLHPLVIVFEPDLLDNYGLADQVNAVLAERLIAATSDGATREVTFDLTLNGFARSANLLTLAFTPPFLAATLCLLMAAFALGWRSFLRFGPPRRTVRAIAFGKRALVENAAGLLRRTRRLHLVTAPYADAARDRLAKSLALPRQPDAAATEAAIDRALTTRRPGAEPFSAIAARLRAARRPHDMLAAARDLHSLERMLTR